MYECDMCSATFWTKYDREDHLNDWDHWIECETCDRAFSTQRACNQHMNATDHWAPRYECETCPAEFRTQGAANQHMNARGHWAPSWPCETCSKMFHSEAAASKEEVDKHMTRAGHFKTYCPSCDKHFMNENNLRMHLNSKAHRGSGVLCPFCKTAYTTASGLLHHLERGSCARAPSLNRETILRLVRARDADGIITTKRIGWRDGDEDGGQARLRATPAAFNGAAWECYLCHRQFRAVEALDAHVNSPVHMQAVYRCPNVAGRCGREFTTLAGLFAHLESESCGFMRFERVQRSVGTVLQGRKMIAF
ncbi:putative zinc finger protein [Lineolata rhizophorae]|uniref:Putative zinc finger protein n=1 Tax=Lineolata rhizophorae TaxID=578093 RepID=A0A6A6NTS3_9PEZI|nr:putative zinc finger protein [Lineolata rhizophorae]